MTRQDLYALVRGYIYCIIIKYWTPTMSYAIQDSWSVRCWTLCWIHNDDYEDMTLAQWKGNFSMRQILSIILIGDRESKGHQTSALRMLTVKCKIVSNNLSNAIVQLRLCAWFNFGWWWCTNKVSRRHQEWACANACEQLRMIDQSKSRIWELEN